MPCVRHAGGTPVRALRFAREAVTGIGGQHEVESVFGLSAVGGRIGERVDGLEKLEGRSGPAVGHDQRHGVRMRRAYVDELNVETVDRRHELWQAIQSRLRLSPVVIAGPVLYEGLQLRQLHSLRRIFDSFAFGPTGGSQAAPKVN